MFIDDDGDDDYGDDYYGDNNGENDGGDDDGNNVDVLFSFPKISLEFKYEKVLFCLV
jgi:hypothetical protein